MKLLLAASFILLSLTSAAQEPVNNNRQELPVPSIIRPLRINTSQLFCCAYRHTGNERRKINFLIMDTTLLFYKICRRITIRPHHDTVYLAFIVRHKLKTEIGIVGFLFVSDELVVVEMF